LGEDGPHRGAQFVGKTGEELGPGLLGLVLRGDVQQEEVIPPLAGHQPPAGDPTGWKAEDAVAALRGLAPPDVGPVVVQEEAPFYGRDRAGGGREVQQTAGVLVGVNVSLRALQDHPAEGGTLQDGVQDGVGERLRSASPDAPVV